MIVVRIESVSQEAEPIRRTNSIEVTDENEPPLGPAEVCAARLRTDHDRVDHGLRPADANGGTDASLRDLSARRRAVLPRRPGRPVAESAGGTRSLQGAARGDWNRNAGRYRSVVRRRPRIEPLNIFCWRTPLP